MQIESGDAFFFYLHYLHQGCYVSLSVRLFFNKIPLKLLDGFE